MMANLMLMSEQTDGAIDTYSQLLDKAPDNYNTLAQLIELLMRAGRIPDIAKYIEKAEKSSKRS
jgi:tetratricopeptide (TPR) repeat protein